MSESLVGTRVIAIWGAMFPQQEGTVVADYGDNVKIVFDMFGDEEFDEAEPLETLATVATLRDYADYVNRRVEGSPIGIYWL